MKISVIGAGYVGLTTAACLAEIGHTVRCADNDETKLNLLRSGRVPFFELHLETLVRANCQAGRLLFETTEEAVSGAEAIFICVGTPPLENGEADLSAVANVARTIGQRASGNCLVIEKSTVPVQTGQQLERQLQRYSRPDLRCDLVSNPEFLREGSALYDFFHPERIVIGVDRDEVAGKMADIYRPVLDQSFVCPVHEAGCPSRVRPAWVVTDTNSAELIKHASNSFLAMKISFINMVANLCESVGADVSKVALGMGLDARIGSAFLNPGIGFGGFCFPKDVQAFVRIAEKAGCDFSLLKEVEKINQSRIEHFIALVRSDLWVLRGRKIALWGLAFKPNTDDVRFAPALELARALIREGAIVRAYDPEAAEKAKAVLPEIQYCANPYEAAEDAEAVLIATEWKEFREIDWTRLRSLVQRPLLVDGRNMFEPAEITRHGFHYISIGRKPALCSAQESPVADVPAVHAVALAMAEVLPTMLSRYVLITPARNEAQFIELTLQSVVGQTVRPVRWVIVSDGSTDGTDDIVARYAAQHSWIELVRMPERRERDFAGKVHAFNAGFLRVQNLQWEVIASLDGDISFDPDYFAFLLSKLESDPKLGLVGTPFQELTGESYDYRFVNVEHVSGACQVFRRECFTAIGGYLPVKGGSIDHIAVLTARLRGWKTRTFTEKVCLHHREMGTAQQSVVRSRFLYGAKDYRIGNHPLWEMFRTVHQMRKRPLFLGGAALGVGYAWAWLQGMKRPVSDELIAFHRQEQMQRLKSFLGWNKISSSQGQPHPPRYV